VIRLKATEAPVQSGGMSSPGPASVLTPVQKATRPVPLAIALASTTGRGPNTSIGPE
jgi:hypothetical protein